MSWPSYKHITAKKPHTCIWCGEVITTGERYVRNTLVFEGEFQSNAFHVDCSVVAFTQDLEYGFEPHEHERGSAKEKGEA